MLICLHASHNVCSTTQPHPSIAFNNVSCWWSVCLHEVASFRAVNCSRFMSQLNSGLCTINNSIESLFEINNELIVSWLTFSGDIISIPTLAIVWVRVCLRAIIVRLLVRGCAVSVWWTARLTSKLLHNLTQANEIRQLCKQNCFLLYWIFIDR